MIKKNYITYITVLALFMSYIFTFAHISFAQTPTGVKKVISATPAQKITPSKEQRDIDILKDKIATKVAELRKKSKTVLSGVITKISNSEIELEKSGDSLTKISLDESVTTFYKASLDQVEEVETKNVTAKDYIVAFGENIDGEFQATAVYQDTSYLVLRGTVTDINKTDFTIEAITFDKERYTLDIEKNTIQNIVNTKSLKIEKGGFSKVVVGDTLHFVIEKTSESRKTYPAHRLLIIPQAITKGS